MINNTTKSEDPPEKASQEEEKQEGGSDMASTITNKMKNMPGSSFAWLPEEKWRKTTNGVVVMTAYTQDETTGVVNQAPGRLVRPDGEVYVLDGERWRHTLKPKITVPPDRLISLSTDLLRILGMERRPQA